MRILTSHERTAITGGGDRSLCVDSRELYDWLIFNRRPLPASLPPAGGTALVPRDHVDLRLPFDLR